MKLLATTFFALLLTSQPASIAQNSNVDQIQFTFNQANQVLNLEQKEFETIYRTDQVPDTCYRDEIQGTRNECHTEYDRRCETRYEQQCGYEPHRVCTNVPRNVCQTVQRCTTHDDQVCTPRGCTRVPRRSCVPVQQCSTQNDQVCHTEQRYECRSVPRQYCQDIPRQACRSVPNVVRVPYSCTRPVQVPVGERVKFTTAANISIVLENFSEVGQLSDVMVARLQQGQISVTVLDQSQSAFLYQVINQQQTVEMISANEKRINAVFTIRAISVEGINALLRANLNHSRIALDRIEFGFDYFGNAFSQAPLKGHLKILQRKNERTSYIIVDDDFTNKNTVGQGAAQVMMLNSFGVKSLSSGKYHFVELSIKPDLNALRKNLLNPETLKRISDKALVAEFEGLPTN